MLSILIRRHLPLDCLHETFSPLLSIRHLSAVHESCSCRHFKTCMEGLPVEIEKGSRNPCQHCFFYRFTGNNTRKFRDNPKGNDIGDDTLSKDISGRCNDWEGVYPELSSRYIFYLI